MNSFYKKINGLVICALLISASSLHSMEENESAKAQNSEWNKQNIIVLSLVVTALYVCAVYQDKIASPAALWKRMFYQPVTEPIIIEPIITQSKEEPTPQKTEDNEDYDHSEKIVCDEEIVGDSDTIDDGDKEEENIQYNDDNLQDKVENSEVPAQHDDIQNDVPHELNNQNATKIKSRWNKFNSWLKEVWESDMITE
jgi:hypothetical protein